MNLTKTFVGAVLAVVILGAIGSMSTARTSPPPTEPTPVSPQKEARFQATVRTLQAIKHGARNPASIVFEDVLATDDGSTVCVTVRGQNGFGGFTRSSITAHAGTINTTTAAWNKHCADRSLTDMHYAVRALD